MAMYTVIGKVGRALRVNQRRRRLLLWAGVGLGFVLALLIERTDVLGGYIVFLILLVGIFAIEAMSLGLINGFTGQFSLGHATFMGVGAYVSALLTSKAAHLPFLPALLLGGVVAALAAVLLGFPVFKLKGDYVCVITLVINLILVNLLLNFDYAGGPRGLIGVQSYSSPAWIYLWVVITYMVLRNLVFSTHGRALQAVREDEAAAALVGVNTYKLKLLSFSIACFFAGIGGGLFAHTLRFIAPQNFTFFVSIDILVMTLLGGSGSLFGAILGAIGFRVFLEALRPLGLWRMVVAPMVLVLIVFFRPQGLYGSGEPAFLRDEWEDTPRGKKTGLEQGGNTE